MKTNTVKPAIQCSLFVKPLLFSLLVVALSQGSLVSAHEAHCEDTRLGELMSDMKMVQRKLKRQIRSEDFDAIAQSVEVFKELSVKSEAERPLKFKADKDSSKESLTKYQNSLHKLSKQLDVLAQAAKAKDLVKIEESYQKIQKLKKSGHKKFRLDCD